MKDLKAVNGGPVLAIYLGTRVRAKPVDSNQLTVLTIQWTWHIRRLDSFGAGLV